MSPPPDTTSAAASAALDRAADWLRRASRVTVLTGAGVSAESGIATFRDALTGLWARFDPLQLATPEAFLHDPARVWGWYEQRRRQVLTARPNAAHLALAALAGRVGTLQLVTQNVDDLHERAGSTDVIHLHGSLHAPRCFDCGAPHALPAELPQAAAAALDDRPLEPPHCRHCTGLVRPGVVWFTEALPPEAWARAQAAAEACELFLSIGTSGLVQPAARLPALARRQGARVLVINPDRQAGAEADLQLLGPAAELLPALLARAGPGR